MFFFVISTNANTNETIESLLNENRVLNEATELHLTSADAPMVNSTVDLAHADAWLFFDNIKPSVFLTDYAGFIYINGEKLANGFNGRVAIYAQGTVIMPHSSTFKPLIVYTEANFGGDSKEFEPETYHNSLNDWDNNIKSFKLKRGYMVTFASNADGSGYSRVFTADKNDITFSVMPDELDGTISFIRVFKHQWVSKKGWCGWNFDEYQMVNATCYYDWNSGGNTTANTEYSPIRQKADWPSWTDINAKRSVSHLLGFNEPDRPDQANMSFDQMIEIWPGMMNSGLRIGSPAWSNPWSGTGGNLFDFINTCDELNYRVDFVALHCYWGGKSPISWYNDLKYIHEATGRPLWITEWNNGANWTTEWWPDDTYELTEANAQKQLNDIMGILQVLDTAHFVERYFIYNWVEDRRAMILNGELTPAGEYYAANKSAIAYNASNDVVPHWNYSLPELSYKYLSLSNAIRLEWLNANGDLCSELKVEKKINGGDFETLWESNDMSKLFYLDTLNSSIYGDITYQISLYTKQGDVLVSNAVSYKQTSGSNTIQHGKFNVDTYEWNTTQFSEKFSAEPAVVLGISSFNNTSSLSNRLNNITKNSVKFRIQPWDFLNGESLDNADELPLLALEPNRYNFEGLQAEANVVSEVSRDWKQVTFSTEFNQVPVIFSSVASANTSYPLTVSIQNVTTIGFEVSLKTESSVTGSVSAETVNFLAIEPGTGIINGKPVTVGKSEGESGSSSEPVVISLDSTYSDPVFFAGFQSVVNNYASSLRYLDSGTSNIKLIKQIESSGNQVVTTSDLVGWMVMDLAGSQNNTGISQDAAITNETLFFPNPAMDNIYFNNYKTNKIEIFDFSGRKIFSAYATSLLNI
ncbi:MAG: glycosyl hydrolase, partial [Salinivirgaceae bacterium]|nr:glycosyl hydrolase [Salinivirgaceae bacterium]